MDLSSLDDLQVAVTIADGYKMAAVSVWRGTKPWSSKAAAAEH